MQSYTSLDADQAIRSRPAVWFELHGAIFDKLRKIVHGPTSNKMQREIDEIILYCEELRIPCRIVTLKGRQQGSSTFSVAAVYHALRGRPAKACIVGDEYDKSVRNLVDMFNLFAGEDTFDWGNKFDRAKKSFTNGSLLTTESANDNRAGASGTYQVALMTECAWWKEAAATSAKATFAAFLNCVPEEPGTLVIVESTPNGVGGVYHETFTGAVSLADHKAGKIPENWNGFFSVFYAWHEHPEYDLQLSQDELQAIEISLTEREMELREQLNLPASRLAWRRRILHSPRFSGDEERLEQEYPSDPTSGFLLSGRRAFSMAMVAKLKGRALREPESLRVEYGTLEWKNDHEKEAVFRITSEDEAMLRVWERPIGGCRYLLPVDPMTGASQTSGADPDSHGAGVIRAGYFHQGAWREPALVARLADCWAEKRDKKGRAICRWDIDVLEQMVARLSIMYGNCPIISEINMDRGMIELLKVRGANLYRRRIYNRLQGKETDAYGWQTSTATRGPIVANLARAIRLQGEEGDGLAVWDIRVVKEMDTMIVLPNGREEAMVGTHDDQIFMLAIGLANMDVAQTYHLPRRAKKYGYEDDDEPMKNHTYS